MPFFHEQDLLARFNRRDPDAVAWVYKTYYSFVYSVVKKLTSGSSNTKDLVADSFIKLLQYKGQFNSLAKIKQFLFVAAKNTCLDFFKHLKTKQKKSIVIQKEWIPDLKNVEEAAETIAEHRQLIFKSIQNLPPKCRQVFVLYYIYDLKNSEIANELGVSEKTVSNQKNIAKKILKLKMSKVKTVSLSFFLLGSYFTSMLSEMSVVFSGL